LERSYGYFQVSHSLSHPLSVKKEPFPTLFTPEGGDFSGKKPIIEDEEVFV
jgi:hypothetical protein